MADLSIYNNMLFRIFNSISNIFDSDPSCPAKDCKHGRSINIAGKEAEGMITKVCILYKKVSLFSDINGYLKYLYKNCMKDGALDPPTRTLDLISHSTKVCLLGIGGEVLDKSQNTKNLFHEIRSNLLDLHIKRVRLLGCGTAFSQEGVNAMAAIADVLRNDDSNKHISVWGTNKIIDNNFYDNQGFKVCLEQSTLCESTPGLQPRTNALYSQFDIMRERLVDLSAIMRNFFDMSRVGKLFEPDKGIRFSGALIDSLATKVSTRGGQEATLEALFDWRVIRLTSAGYPHGIYFPVERESDTKEVQNFFR
jgi:hypothetical protein